MRKLVNLSLAFFVLSFASLQSGCLKDNSSSTYPDVTASADTIMGILKYKQTDTSGTKLVDWHFGTGNIRAVIESENIATAAVESDGTFMLILPKTISGAYFTSLSDIANTQGGTIKVTPETVKFMGSLQFMVDYTENGKAKSVTINLARLNTDLSVYRTYYYIFYDSDGSFTGKATTGNIFSWTFIKGWGMVESYIMNSSTNSINSRSVNAAPANATWSN